MKPSRSLAAAGFAALSALLLCSCGGGGGAKETEQTAPTEPKAEDRAGEPAPVIASPRLVALDAGLAETLAMLGLGGHIAARTAFTDFPSALTNLPVVMGSGGLATLDYEALAAAKPDYVILPESFLSEALHKELESRRLSHFTVRNGTFSDYCQCVFELADRFQVADTATLWLRTLDEQIAEAEGRIGTAVARAGGRPPKVLLLLGRPVGRTDHVIAAGRRSFHQGLLDALSLPNVCAGEVPYAEMSIAEAAALDPDILVEVCSVAPDPDAAVRNALLDWASHPGMSAVRTGSVHILTESWGLRVGPRLDLLLAALADWTESWAAAAAPATP